MKPTYQAVSRLDSNRELAIALGNMIVAWSAAEGEMRIALKALLGVDQQTATKIFVNAQMFEARARLIRVVLDTDTPRNIKRWKGLDLGAIRAAISRLSALSKTRNNWVHHMWMAHKNTRDILLVDYRQRFDSLNRSRPVKAADINNHCVAVLLHAAKLKSAVLGRP